MKIKLPLTNDDWMMLRVPGLVLACCLVLAATMYFVANIILGQSTQAMANTSRELQRVQTAIEQISMEEETVVRYIDRYFLAESSGALREENRLELLEKFANIRESLHFFPLTVEIESQAQARLEYSPDDPLPGEALALNASVIRLSTGLLHEGDFVKFFSELSRIDSIFQPIRCELVEQSSQTGGFSSLIEYINTECSLVWYSIDLAPETDSTGFFF
ncbi:MAG: hypothetical protein Q7W55_08405 [Pseudohongiella sp.]|nr:hypothetical protein [Pseudohongiella sp.]MDO9519889.1 hypothetical protein [Pseudohongiella sp.]MDP2126820.1 hypothetical protein [Pseudohongiella sp.]